MSCAAPSARSVRGLVGVLGAEAASWSATRLLSIALPWFVLSTTGSASQTGLVIFCQMAPYVVCQVLSGPLIDRIGPKQVSVVGDVAAMAAMIVVPLLYVLDALPLWALMVLVAVVGAADGPSNAAKGVFVPTVTKAAQITLERATGFAGAVERTASMVGPAIAGLIVGAFGGVYALWISAALFGLGGLIVSTTLSNRLVDVDLDVDVDERDSGYLQQLREGATFLGKERLLRSITGMVAVTNLLDQAFIAVLLPLWAKRSGHGAETVGLLVSVFSATSIVASLAAAAVGARLPRRAVYLIGFIVGGVPRFVVMVLNVPLWPVLVVFAVGGFGSGLINPIIGAISYERIPAALLGRVRTLTQSLAWSGIPFGGLVAGTLTAAAGLSPALLIVGGCYLVAIVVPGMNKAWSANRLPATSSDASYATESAGDSDGAGIGERLIRHR